MIKRIGITRRKKAEAVYFYFKDIFKVLELIV